MEGHVSTRSSSLIVTSRVLLVVLAGLVAMAGLVLGNRESQPPAASAEAHFVYVCPMHPKVVSASPGDCPVCRMALEPKPLPREAPSGSSERSPARSSPAVTLPAKAEFRAFDAVSRAKPYALSLEMRASAWAEDSNQGSAIFYRDEAELLVPGEEGTFLPAPPVADGKVPGTVVRVSASPAEPWDDRTTRIVFTRTAGTLRAGQMGSVKFATRLRTGLVVRSSAVLQSPTGPYVFVVSDDRRTVSKRAIQIGNVLYGYAAVTGGLHEGEQVAAKYAPSLAAEFQQKREVEL